MKVFKYALLTVGVLSLIGGSIYTYNQIQRLEEYCYKFKDVVIRKANITDTVLELVIEFTNNSKLSAIVYGYNIDIIINGKSAGSINDDKKIKIGSARKFNLPVRLQFNPRKVLNIENFWNAIQSVDDKSAFVIKFSGNIVIGVFGGVVKKTIIVDNKYTLSEMIRMSTQESTQPEICNYN